MNESASREQDVTFDVRARASGKLRSVIELSGRWPGNKVEVVQMETDESQAFGGEGTAAPPLAHFATALVGSLMSHIRKFAGLLGIPLDDVAISAAFKWGWRWTHDALYEARPDSIAIDIEIKSDAPEGDLLRLVDLAKKGCFIEQTMLQGVAISHRLRRPGGWTSL